MAPPRIHLIGRKNAGKTTLITELIAYLTATGKRVGSIKHTHHRHELDVPGKDSFLHRQAGASPVAIVSPNMTALFLPNPTGIAADGYSSIESIWDDCDFVLVEGDSKTDQPKIEVWRSTVVDEPLARTDPSIHAVISDDRPNVEQPVWPRSSLEQIAGNLLNFADQLAPSQRVVGRHLPTVARTESEDRSGDPQQQG
jgi:molybdopterin-guanine dinucleotide biosynthesis protein B